jgi:hypothetical protein
MKMTDNLVKRLRDGCVTGNYEGLEFIEWSKSNATMNEAADRIEALWTVFQETTNKWHDALDRIEALEAVLRKLVDAISNHNNTEDHLMSGMLVGVAWHEAIDILERVKNDQP